MKLGWKEEILYLLVPNEKHNFFVYLDPETLKETKRVEKLKKENFQKIYLVSSSYHVFVQTKLTMFAQTYKLIFNGFQINMGNYEVSKNSSQEVKEISEQHEIVSMISWRILLGTGFAKYSPKRFRIIALEVDF